MKQPPLDEGGSGRFVASYPDFIEYLREKHRSIRIGTLPFESKISAAHAGGKPKNTVLYMLPGDFG